MNWDQKLRAAPRAIAEEGVSPLVDKPDDLVGRTFRAVIQSPGRVYGAMARVRVLSLTKSRIRVRCEVLTGRLKGHERTVLVCNLVADKDEP